MNNPLFQRIVVGVSIIATIVINALANILPYNGKTTAEISDSFAIYFVPAGYVFSIWGVFYRDWETDRKSTRLNSSHSAKSRMPSSA